MKPAVSPADILGPAVVAGAGAGDLPVAGSAIPGWYGKLPSLGDFASRRMAPDFLHAWDAWLAAGLADWSARDPEGWLAAYLAAPTWRFLMVRGTGRGSRGDAFAADPVTAGVLMPSVDRVGRYFPFTLARALPRLPADAAEAGELLAWLHRADDLAVDALHDDWTVDGLEAALAALATEAPAWFDDRSRTRRSQRPARPITANFPEPIGTAIAPGLRERSPCTELPDLLSAHSAALGGAGQAGEIWWLCADACGALHLRISGGLPEGADFAALLGRPVGGSGGSSMQTFNPGDLP